jgi:hypothetical protein
MFAVTTTRASGIVDIAQIVAQAATVDLPTP